MHSGRSAVSPGNAAAASLKTLPVKRLLPDHLDLTRKDVAVVAESRRNRVESKHIGASKRAELLPADRRTNREALPAEAVGHGAIAPGGIAFHVQMDAAVVMSVERYRNEIRMQRHGAAAQLM